MAPKRRRESDIFDFDSDSFVGFDPYEISISAAKRRTLSSLDTSCISMNFDPPLRSTLRSGALPRVVLPEDPVEEAQPESDSWSDLYNILELDAVSHEDSTCEVPSETPPAHSETPSVLNETPSVPSETFGDCSLTYNQTAVASNGHTSSRPDPYVDPITITSTIVPVDTTPTFTLCRNGSQNGKDVIIIRPIGHMYICEGKLTSDGRLLWACHCKKADEKCRSRIDTPCEYDNPDEPDELRVKLDVNVRKQKGKSVTALESHNCHPIDNLYAKLVNNREVKRTGKARPDLGATEIATAYVNNLDSNNGETHGLRSIQNQARVVDYHRQEFKSINPTKENVTTFEIDYNNPIVSDFVKADVVTNNKNKKGENEQHRSIFCCTNEQLEILKTVEELRIDGTFKIVASPFYQLVSLHAFVRHGHQRKSMPLGYILMTGKSQADYTQIFQKVKEVVEGDGPSWNLVNVMLDFEMALRNSLKAVWPNIRLSGCWFHYCQAIWRRVQKLPNLEGMYHTAFGLKYIKRIMLLPLFHANDGMIGRVFNEILRLFNGDKDKLNPEVRDSFEKFFSYVSSQWVNNPKIPTSELSVFDTDVRTNNTSENCNGKMWKNAKGRSKPFYPLLNFLQNERKKDINIFKLQKPKENKKQIAKDKKIQKIWDEMKAKTITIGAVMDGLTEIVFNDPKGFSYARNMMQYTCDDIDEVNE